VPGTKFGNGLVEAGKRTNVDHGIIFYFILSCSAKAEHPVIANVGVK
jgi:hypothetical protein